MSDLKVTSLEELKKASGGEIVELPPFISGTKFIARLRRPSLMRLVKDGKIPNQLIVRANQLFNADGEGFDEEDVNMLKEMYEVLELICKNCFVNPTYDELEKNEIKLTDEQMTFVFNYCQRGVQVLDRFHTVEENQ